MDDKTRRLKITGGEHRWDVCVRDAETGEIIENVTAIEWRYKAGEEWATATITLADVPVELIENHPGYRWVRPPLPGEGSYRFNGGDPIPYRNLPSSERER